MARQMLNRPERLNAIGDGMPAKIRAAVQWCEVVDEAHVIVGRCGPRLLRRQ
jgi:enoyl-CoA hydratase